MNNDVGCCLIVRLLNCRGEFDFCNLLEIGALNE